MIETMLWFIGTMTADITMVGTDIMRNAARCACVRGCRTAKWSSRRVAAADRLSADNHLL